MKSTFYILLFVTFIDFMGIGLVYPLFSTMLFDTSFNFLPKSTSSEMRGFWLGFLLALMPLVQFFTSVIWGAISDNKGRKNPLQISLCITILGHMIGVFGVLFASIHLFLLSRIVLGIGCGNISIVQASISDMSTKEQKIKK